jgi:hypothetical protein
MIRRPLDAERGYFVKFAARWWLEVIPMTALWNTSVQASSFA